MIAARYHNQNTLNKNQLKYFGIVDSSIQMLCIKVLKQPDLHLLFTSGKITRPPS